eukprot:scaffold59245_cov36-Tisochrysis_lutea.AAC.3
MGIQWSMGEKHLDLVYTNWGNTKHPGGEKHYSFGPTVLAEQKSLHQMHRNVNPPHPKHEHPLRPFMDTAYLSHLYTDSAGEAFAV